MIDQEWPGFVSGLSLPSAQDQVLRSSELAVIPAGPTGGSGAGVRQNPDAHSPRMKPAMRQAPQSLSTADISDQTIIAATASVSARRRR
jgi:hypothetical protein